MPIIIYIHVNSRDAQPWPIAAPPPAAAPADLEPTALGSSMALPGEGPRRLGQVGGLALRQPQGPRARVLAATSGVPRARLQQQLATDPHEVRQAARA